MVDARWRIALVDGLEQVLHLLPDFVLRQGERVLCIVDDLSEDAGRKQVFVLAEADEDEPVHELLRLAENHQRLYVRIVFDKGMKELQPQVGIVGIEFLGDVLFCVRRLLEEAIRDGFAALLHEMVTAQDEIELLELLWLRELDCHEALALRHARVPMVETDFFEVRDDDPFAIRLRLQHVGESLLDRCLRILAVLLGVEVFHRVLELHHGTDILGLGREEAESGIRLRPVDV